MINIKDLDPNKIKIDQKSYKNVLIFYYIGYATVKKIDQVKGNSANPLQLIIDKTNKQSNGNKHLTLAPTDGSNEILKKYEELCPKRTYQIKN